LLQTWEWMVQKKPKETVKQSDCMVMHFSRPLI
jgi:hypothetical protein